MACICGYIHWYKDLSSKDNTFVNGAVQNNKRWSTFQFSFDCGIIFAVSGDITCCLHGFVPQEFLQSLQHQEDFNAVNSNGIYTVWNKEHWVQNLSLKSYSCNHYTCQGCHALILY